MYPGYKAEDVLEMPAITFFSLLSEGYRMKYWHYQMLAQISDLPQATEETRKQFYKDLEWASTHPSDILKSSGKGSSPTEIKKLLNGR